MNMEQTSTRLMDATNDELSCECQKMSAHASELHAERGRLRWLLFAETAVSVLGSILASVTAPIFGETSQGFLLISGTAIVFLCASLFWHHEIEGSINECEAVLSLIQDEQHRRARIAELC